MMDNINIQITHWRTSAAEDWYVAQKLVEDGSIRHGLFFAHLTLEKILKAHVCHQTQELAPRIHTLRRLVILAEVDLDQEMLDVLAEMNDFNLSGRYPEHYSPVPSDSEAERYMRRTKWAYTWLDTRLNDRLEEASKETGEQSLNPSSTESNDT